MWLFSGVSCVIFEQLLRMVLIALRWKELTKLIEEKGYKVLYNSAYGTNGMMIFLIKFYFDMHSSESHHFFH